METSEDILSEFPDLAAVERIEPTKTSELGVALTEAQQRVYDLIGLEAVHIDDIIAQGEVTPTEASHILLVLQMESLIQEVEGRRYIRTP